uniref:Uncharacterized protein n=1 Tax=Clytia hemisphaerica TaxID=252671 RepID=A0A7M5V1Q3_9CNID
MICKANLHPQNVHVSLALQHSLKSTKVPCTKCQTPFALLEILNHESKCQSVIKISDVFELKCFPRHVDDAALHVIKQKMDSDKTVKFASGGPRPVTFTKLTQNYVPSERANKRTVQKRNREMMENMSVVAGPSQKSINFQSAKLVNSFTEAERQSILEHANIRPVIEGRKMLAMRLQFGLSWGMLRGVSGWLRSFNIKPESEAKQRQTMKRIENAVVKGILATFTFPCQEEKGKFIVGSSGWAFMENSKEHLLGRLDSIIR